MTRGHLKGEIDTFLAYLRERGQKVTSQRARVAEQTFAMHEHFTAETMYERLKREAPISRATVYRTIGLLVDGGFVREHDFGSDSKTYEHIVGHPHHAHLICVRCGDIVEFESPKIDRLLSKEAHEREFDPIRDEITVYGRCSRCVRD